MALRTSVPDGGSPLWVSDSPAAALLRGQVFPTDYFTRLFVAQAGGVWAPGVLRRWDGTQWAVQKLRRWNGTEWVTV